MVALAQRGESTVMDEPGVVGLRQVQHEGVVAGCDEALGREAAGLRERGLREVHLHGPDEASDDVLWRWRVAGREGGVVAEGSDRRGVGRDLAALGDAGIYPTWVGRIQDRQG